MPILNGMASWPERVESEVVEEKQQEKIGQYLRTHARKHVYACVRVSEWQEGWMCVCWFVLLF